MKLAMQPFPSATLFVADDTVVQCNHVFIRQRGDLSGAHTALTSTSGCQ